MTTKTKREISKIIVHCSATQEGREYDIKDITKWHKEKGYKNVGYHFVVLLNGAIEVGRDIEEIGAHVVGHNKDSIGICYIGGLDKQMKSKDTRTPAQKKSLTGLIKILKKIYPEATVYGHNDFNKDKDCPCFDAKEEYKNVILWQ